YNIFVRKCIYISTNVRKVFLWYYERFKGRSLRKFLTFVKVYFYKRRWILWTIQYKFKKCVQLNQFHNKFSSPAKRVGIKLYEMDWFSLLSALFYSYRENEIRYKPRSMMRARAVLLK